MCSGFVRGALVDNGWRAIFYAVLLSLLVVFFSSMALHAFHHGTGELTFQNAMLDNVKLVLGALLGLVTGYTMGRSNPDKGSNEKPSA